MTFNTDRDWLLKRAAAEDEYDITIGVPMPLNVEHIAQCCHELNRAYCGTIGDHSQLPWIDAEQWQRDSAIQGVQFALAAGVNDPQAQHEAWLKDKLRAGWVYGPVKDPAKKEHPCCVPYAELPAAQRMKDYLFLAVVEAFQKAAR